MVSLFVSSWNVANATMLTMMNTHTMEKRIRKKKNSSHSCLTRVDYVTRQSGKVLKQSVSSPDQGHFHAWLAILFYLPAETPASLECRIAAIENRKLIASFNSAKLSRFHGLRAPPSLFSFFIA